MKVGQAQWQMRIEEETCKAEVEIGEAIEARPNGKGMTAGSVMSWQSQQTEVSEITLKAELPNLLNIDNAE